MPELSPREKRVAALWGAYARLTGNMSKDQIEEIEVSGPLSKDPSIRAQQQAYRAWLQEATGNILTEDPDGVNHHQV